MHSIDRYPRPCFLRLLAVKWNIPYAGCSWVPGYAVIRLAICSSWVLVLLYLNCGSLLMWHLLASCTMHPLVLSVAPSAVLPMREPLSLCHLGTSYRLLPPSEQPPTCRQ